MKKLSLFLALWSAQSFAQELELHAHAFMNEGMTWGFVGEFNGPLRSTSWKDRFKSAMNPETLNKSGLKVVVMSLYSHPLFVMSLRNSIESQIEAARAFVAEYPEWVLTDSADEALKQFDSGKRILILSLEGASGIVERDKDIERFVEKGGISIITLLHLIDDDIGGVALLKGFKSLSTPWGWLLSQFSKNTEDGININARGLTKEGDKLTRKLLDRGVWIDLAHASDHSLEDLLPILDEYKQPPLFTHTSLRRYMKAERGLSDAMLKIVDDREGFVGLMPSQDLLEGTPAEAGFPVECDEGLLQLVKQMNDVSSVLPARSMALGSDFHGGLEHLRHPCKELPYFGEGGFHRVDQVPELWSALGAAGLKQKAQYHESAREFLLRWGKAQGGRKKAGSI